MEATAVAAASASEVTAASASARACELPRFLEALLERVPPSGLVELERVLRGHLFRARPAAERRVQELSHLAELLESEFAVHLPHHPRAPVQVSQCDYDRTRPNGAPSAEMLVDRYVYWEWACRAAWGLRTDGSKSKPGQPWAHPLRGKRRQYKYTREDVIDSIRECALALCRRPSSNVFQEWTRAERRRRKRAGGQPRHPHSSAEGRRPVRLADMHAVYKQFSSWAAALAAANISDAELGSARLKLLGVPDQPATVKSWPGSTPAERLLALDASALAELGLRTRHDSQRLARRGFGHLPVSRAAAFAHALGGSLAWLAGSSVEPGDVCAPDAHFNGPEYTRRRKAAGVRENSILCQARLGVVNYRRIIRESVEPTLDTVSRFARAVGCSVDELVSATRR